MTGGIVISKWQRERDNLLLIRCRGTGTERNDTCDVVVDPGEYTFDDIAHGDGLWWQYGRALWTSRHTGEEIILRKVGYSGHYDPAEWQAEGQAEPA